MISTIATQYAKLFTLVELERRLSASDCAAQRQADHNAQVGATQLGLATLAAEQEQNTMLREAIRIRGKM